MVQVYGEDAGRNYCVQLSDGSVIKIPFHDWHSLCEEIYFRTRPPLKPKDYEELVELRRENRSLKRRLEEIAKHPIF